MLPSAFGGFVEFWHFRNLKNPIQIQPAEEPRWRGREAEPTEEPMGGSLNFLFLQPDLNEERLFWYRVCAEVTGCWWECVWWWSADHTGQTEARNPRKKKEKAVREAYFLFGAAFAGARLNKSAVFYMSAERPPALGDVWRDPAHPSSHERIPLL